MLHSISLYSIFCSYIVILSHYKTTALLLYRYLVSL